MQYINHTEQQNIVTFLLEELDKAERSFAADKKAYGAGLSEQKLNEMALHVRDLGAKAQQEIQKLNNASGLTMEAANTSIDVVKCVVMAISVLSDSIRLNSTNTHLAVQYAFGGGRHTKTGLA